MTFSKDNSELEYWNYSREETISGNSLCNKENDTKNIIFNLKFEHLKIYEFYLAS